MLKLYGMIMVKLFMELMVITHETDSQWGHIIKLYFIWIVIFTCIRRVAVGQLFFAYNHFDG